MLHVPRCCCGAGCEHRQDSLENLHDRGNTERQGRQSRRDADFRSLRSASLVLADPGYSRRRIYVGTGENYSHPASDKSDSILALDLATGRILWSYQALADDIWNAACASGANCAPNTGPDYDFGAPPVLVKLKTGRSLVLAGQKSGYVYALDPDKGGALVWKAKPGRGGIMGGVHWGMTSDGEVLYSPVSDLSVYPRDAHLPAQSGLHALDAATGAKLWSRVLPDTCGQTTWRCSPGVSAAATLAPGVVFGGSLDGMLRAFSAKDGSILWSFDTNREFEAMNGVKAYGGSIDSSGPVIAGARMFATSGYDKFGQKAGIYCWRSGWTERVKR